MGILLGIIRFILVSLVMITGTVVILILALFPFRVKGIWLAAWIPHFMAKAVYAILWARIICAPEDLARIRQHHGLIFPNHLSYADIVTFFALAPTRFLSNHAVRRMPLIGWIAIAIDTVFVNRDNQKSRAKARLAVTERLKETPYPPLFLAPEGKINNGAADSVLPLAYGAFEIAKESQVPFLPCGVAYSPASILRWWSDHETMYKAMWRVLSTTSRLSVTVKPLAAVLPAPDADIPALAEATRQAMEACLKSLNTGKKKV